MRPTERALELMDELREQLDLIGDFAYKMRNFSDLKRQIEEAHFKAIRPLYREMQQTRNGRSSQQGA